MPWPLCKRFVAEPVLLRIRPSAQLRRRGAFPYLCYILSGCVLLILLPPYLLILRSVYSFFYPSHVIPARANMDAKTVLIVQTALWAIVVPPLLIVWILSFHFAPRSKDSARVAFSYMKAVFPVVIL